MLPDIPKGKFVWIRAASHGWVEQALQQQLVAFLLAFEREHGWVRAGSMTVEERFADTGVNVRVPLGPTGPEQREDNFMQRPGLATVKISATRDRDSRVFEVAVPFPMGNHTPLAALLAAARASLRVQERQAR